MAEGGEAVQQLLEALGGVREERRVVGLKEFAHALAAELGADVWGVGGKIGFEAVKIEAKKKRI